MWLLEQWEEGEGGLNSVAYRHSDTHANTGFFDTHVEAMIEDQLYPLSPKGRGGKLQRLWQNRGY